MKKTRCWLHACFYLRVLFSISSVSFSYFSFVTPPCILMKLFLMTDLTKKKAECFYPFNPKCLPPFPAIRKRREDEKSAAKTIEDNARNKTNQHTPQIIYIHKCIIMSFTIKHHKSSTYVTQIFSTETNRTHQSDITKFVSNVARHTLIPRIPPTHKEKSHLFLLPTPVDR